MISSFLMVSSAWFFEDYLINHVCAPWHVVAGGLGHTAFESEHRFSISYQTSWSSSHMNWASQRCTVSVSYHWRTVSGFQWIGQMKVRTLPLPLETLEKCLTNPCKRPLPYLDGNLLKCDSPIMCMWCLKMNLSFDMDLTLVLPCQFDI